MKRTLLSIISAGLVATAVHAQDNSNPMDTLTQSVMKMQSDVNALKKIKISGYVQSQFQWADSAGIKSFAGGDFPTGVDKRFKVRRAEFKTMYDNGTTQVVANIDITQNGVNIKDAYGKLTEPWLRTFSLTAGIFNRPFGWEVPTSSSLLESPERSRVVQTLFPGERDCGAMITFQRPSTSPLNPLKVEAGWFNGTGNNVNDFDFQKDFIGNIHWAKASKNEKVKYSFGVDYYSGGWVNQTKYVWSVVDTAFKVDSTTTNKGTASKRTYIGADFQLSFAWAPGVTTIRGEYIQGQQPGTSSSSTSPSAAPTTDTYVRQFTGAYFYFLQNIMQTKHQLIVKYDWYDPNTKIAGDAIKSSNKFSSTDVRYTTIGLGWIYHWDANVKIVAYWDMVTNETSAKLNGFHKDIKDNVFTLRVQYKF